MGLLDALNGLSSNEPVTLTGKAAQDYMEKEMGEKVPSGVGVMILPPDEAPSTPELAADPIPPEVLPTLPKEIQEAAAKITPVEAKAVVEGSKGGRKCGNCGLSGHNKKTCPGTSEVAHASEPVAVEPEAPIAIISSSDNITADTESPVPNEYTLFVDVDTHGVDAKDLDPYIDNLMAAICKEYECVDPRWVPSEHPMAYARWKGCLTQLAKLSPPEPGTYFVRNVRESDFRQVVVEALRPLCTVFVRGRY